ncbi:MULTISPECIES: NnrS family protein [unclassified Ensifer]|uniref:NnrS family protein n=1 Tax=unclassified Ensifer TaxID=2633371 RepID=UPI0007127E56|nr:MULTISPECIES: NnrS family protein [unclassified Ensifer]KQX44924.1 short-chain dehydrogenase [Ensifer sp. Root1298]KQX76766.1 short-chain dehydrogenase [Ensifer sp. Root1312]KRC17277.1 short-chain dehydrogenase [Ensifer sp. Root74]KRD62307.1 short-chain dehydrogenase [Ensifer sp. Root954]MBD9559722.1 NnrS family protein [Ensifer sp. ENS03]
MLDRLIRPKPSGGIPRGLSTTGPVLFSYGFRPFFLAAALWAIGAMALWIAALILGLDLAGDYGAAHWHAHEMLFGFSSAVLGGFLLTAIPNWTGRLPVSGRPLAALFGLWVIGRVALLSSGIIGLPVAAAVEALFLPVLLLICAREVIVGRKWKDLKVIGGLIILSAANIWFHLSVLGNLDVDAAARLAIGAYTMLIMIVGGRIVPSFTRNWLNKVGRTDFPVPYNRFDTAAILIGVAALGAWTFAPVHIVTAAIAVIACAFHTVRLLRWHGSPTWPEKLLFVLHAAYAFVPLGFLAISAGAIELLSDYPVMHVLTVGVIAFMMLAVMTRATRGHTGRPLVGSALTSASYVAIAGAALIRPLAEVLPEHYHHLIALSGALWIAAFVLFTLEYGPMLVRERRAPRASP